MITQKRLKELLQYDHHTGIFVWKITRSYTAKIGAIAGTESKGYVLIGLDGSVYKAHRLAWLYVYGSLPKNQIDHRNGVKNDNRITNLRDVTGTINQQNIHSARCDNKLGLLGVCWHKASNKWIAQIRANGRKRYLGAFPSANEACNAYLLAKRELHEGCLI